MTREEAIWTLEEGDWWDFCNTPIDTDTHEKFHEAIDMGIAALRAQPAKLDRSRWDGLQYCPVCDTEYPGDCGTCVYAAMRVELESCKSCAKKYADIEGKAFPGYVSANYCAHCGRPLTPGSLGGAGEEDWRL